MGAKVDVGEVVQLGGRDGLVRESAIDRPAPGTPAPAAPGGWSLDVRGWAVGAAAPVSQVELSVAGTALRRVPCDVSRPALAAERPDLSGAGSSGFHATIGALDLPRQFELSVDAVLADGRRSPLGLIRGTRASLTTTFEPRLQPLMLSGPGRAGSTIFMQMLGGHPSIAVHPPFDEEPRVATYWVEVLRALARPQSWMRQISPAGPLNADWWLGHGDPAPRRLRSQSLQEWLADEAVEDLAAFAQSRIEAVYARVERAADKSGATHFAEKVRNDIVSDLLWELYPDGREIVLVRDPRDVLVSILAATQKRGARSLPDDPGRWVTQEFTGRIMAVLESGRRRAERTHLVRYEDLMMHPRETLAGVLEYVGLESGEESVARMIEAADRRLPGMEEHRTTPNAGASIGRWRRDLAPELLEACERAVGPALSEWGYAPAGSSEPARPSGN